MTTYCISKDKQSKAISGTLTADIKDYRLFTGTASEFITNREVVFFAAQHQLSETEHDRIIFTFPATVENKRYEIIEGGIIDPPSFSQSWKDLCGGTWFRPYRSNKNAGYVEFNFNLAAGTLGAKFGFVILDGPGGGNLLVEGEIKDAAGLEYVLCNPAPTERPPTRARQ